MKKLSLIFILFIGFLTIQGQTTFSDTTKKDFKNVIALDATGLLRQFFNFSTNSYFNYPYMISYRRIFKNNAARILAGGSFSSEKSFQNDTLPNLREYNNFNIGIGFEHYSYLLKRWNLYFGADAIMNYRNNSSQTSWTTTISRKQDVTSYGYGLSPFLGIQFKINSRLSVATETSYEITYTTNRRSDTQTPNPSYDSHSKSNGFQTNFNAPTSLSFRVLF